ncbi:mechanosensitive ion channel family protein [Shimia sp.]|uniref:mechanosensitive ion channel family protein n=1 Tax=Shimia sp. TaxID=1954381 RepID=UPI003BAD3945
MLRQLFAMIFIILLMPLMATAQATSLLPSTAQSAAPEENAAMSQLLQEAANTGMQVIILQPDGSTQTVGAGTASSSYAQTSGTSTDGATLIMRAQSEVDEVRSIFFKRLQALPAAINEVRFILRASSPDGTIMAFVRTLLWSLVFLLLGALAERRIYGPKIAARFVMPMVQKAPQGYSEKLPFLVVRFVGGVIGVAFSMVVAAILGFIITAVIGGEEDSAIRFTLISIFVAYALSRIVALIWRMILSPYLDQYRIPSFSTRDAKRLHRWMFTLGALNICTAVFGEWLKQLGLNYDVFAAMTLILLSVFAIGNLAMVVVNREAISNAIRNGKALPEASLPIRLISTLWAPVFLLYVIYGFTEQAFDIVLGNELSIPPIAGAYMIFAATIVVYATFNFIIERYFDRARKIRAANEAAERAEAEQEAARLAAEAAQETIDGIATETVSGLVLDGDIMESEDDDAELRAFQERMQSSSIHTFEDLARRIAGILALVSGLYAAVNIFGAEEMMVQTNIFDQTLDVAVICFIGYIVFHAFRIWVDTKIKDEGGDAVSATPGDEGGATGASRLATLLPLFRSFILVIIVVSIVLIALLEMGVNVSPLFAGAGVIGLAVGFGAQSLVRDIFSGAFFLFDDAFRKGEYIDIGSVKGTVEKISVRSFQLRHHLGPLHTIPFGEIQYLTNYSRDWVIMKLKLRVTYDTDVERVRKLVKKLGVELLDDPVIGHNFIQPLKSQGVIEMQDSAMIIRVKFMTKPGDQWLVRKKVYQEIRELFAREGIKFAHREVTVRIADDDKGEELSPKQRDAVVGAVEAAIDEDALEEASGGGDDR